MNFKIIGLTGSISSGKSTAAAFFKELGYTVVEADQVSRSVLKPDTECGKQVLNEFGTLDRTELKKIIFNDPSKKSLLESITHPAIKKESEHLFKEAKNQGTKSVIYEAALLVETGRYKDLDLLITVTSSDDLKIKRLEARDQIDTELAKKILQNQCNDAEKIKMAQYTLVNNGSADDLKSQVNMIDQILTTQTDSGILFKNRYNNKIEKEFVYGEKPMRFLYESKLGYLVTDKLLAKAPLSQIYGKYQDTRWSSKKIKPFIRQYNINMSEYETPTHGFNSFNEFFIRPFKKNKREFSNNSNELSAPAEGRYLAFNEINHETAFPVKGMSLSLKNLLGKASSDFKNGSCFIARLCPVDYHRFHFPCNGKITDFFTIHGPLHSVNPIALKKRGDILEINERQVTLIESPTFGKIAYIEVGALCVGKIIQSATMSGEVKKGSEKGYFLFGASTVILIGQQNRLQISEDLLLTTQNKIETFIKLGDTIAKA